MEVKRQFTRHEMERILKKNGWEVARTKGKHTVYINSEGKRLIMGRSNPNEYLFRKHVKEYNMTV